MIAVILLAIIGSHLNLGAGYWILFGVFIIVQFIKDVIAIAKFFEDH